MNLYPIFSDFLSAEKLDLDVKTLALECNRLKNKKTSRYISNVGGYQTTITFEDLTENLQNLKRIILNYCNIIHKELGFKGEQYMDEMWLNINQKGNSNELHNHAGYFFSGVFYIQTDSKSGCIKFENTNIANQFTFSDNLVEKYNCYNSKKYSIQPEENMLLIFPSWLSHYVLPSESQKDRISIAFNTLVNYINKD